MKIEIFNEGLNVYITLCDSLLRCDAHIYNINLSELDWQTYEADRFSFYLTYLDIIVQVIFIYRLIFKVYIF